MGDKLSDFINEIKQRRSSPLFSSFILAWLAINWKIVVGLVLYKNADLKVDGYTSYIDLIKKESNTWHNLLAPLLIALGYTFLYPLFKNGIAAFNTWVEKWGSDWSLRIAKNGNISINKYLQLRAQYYDKLKSLGEVIASESEYLEQNRMLEQTNSQNAQELGRVSKELDKLYKFNKIEIIGGMWEYTYVNDETGEADHLKIRISNNNIHDISHNSNKEIFYIERFYANLPTKSVFLVLIPKKGRESLPAKFQVLHFENDNYLSGSENNRMQVSYKRI